MPCASPDLKQASACGRRPGHGPGEAKSKCKEETHDTVRGGGRKGRGRTWKRKNSGQSKALALVSKGGSSDASVQATPLSASAWDELGTEFFGFQVMPGQKKSKGYGVPFFYNEISFRYHVFSCSFWSDGGVRFWPVLAVKMKLERERKNARWFSLFWL